MKGKISSNVLLNLEKFRRCVMSTCKGYTRKTRDGTRKESFFKKRNQQLSYQKRNKLPFQKVNYG